MKRREVIKRIRDEAARQSVRWILDREGRNHTVYRLDSTMIPIPRHRELDDSFAEKVFQGMRARAGGAVVVEMKTPTYHAVVNRGGKFWAVYVPEIARWTQARHLRELDTITEDLIELMTGAEPGSFTVDYDIQLPESVQQHLAHAERLRSESANAQAEAAAQVRAAARELHDNGLSLRDVGRILGVSYQRAHQLVS